MDRRSKVRAAIYGVLVALLLVQIFDFVGGYDYIKDWFYTPDENVSKIIDSLDLTSRGRRIFEATAPSLDSRDEFNERCDSHNAEIYVLGCYLTADDVIHLYNVEESELDGVKEATAAHELLHAVYLRLPFWEKASLNNQLQAVYDSLDEKDEIKESMALYSNDDFYDELHSRLGTEKKDLPYDLEKHYEAIFNDQDRVVDYYEKYSSTFKKYEKEVEELGKKIDALQAEIDVEEKRLVDVADSLNKRIDDYNKRVSTNNYTDLNAIRAEGNALQAEVDKLKADSAALDKKIDEYNGLIAEYNNSVVKTNKIYNSINSNGEQIEPINN